MMGEHLRETLKEQFLSLSLVLCHYCGFIRDLWGVHMKDSHPHTDTYQMPPGSLQAEHEAGSPPYCPPTTDMQKKVASEMDGSTSLS